MHDVDKVAIDLHVELVDGSVWHPWHGTIALPYRFRYRREREYRLSARRRRRIAVSPRAGS
ncbi:MAG: TraI domain-containing protein [Synergistaceae bacterium]|nr:TraI domain-containing protein [Synergistaceae bacterium]